MDKGKFTLGTRFKCLGRGGLEGFLVEYTVEAFFSLTGTACGQSVVSRL